MGQSPSAPHLPKSPSPASPPSPSSMAPPMPAGAGSGSLDPTPSTFAPPPPARDHTQDLPDEILTLVFASLTPAERNACSLTCARWKEVDAATRHRLSLDARAMLGYNTPAIFSRFTAVTKLALRCARGSGADSLNDGGAAAVAADRKSVV